MKTLFEHLNEYILNEGDSQPGNKTSLIKKFCKQYDIRKYTINNDLTINVTGDVYLKSYNETQLPDYIQFKIVEGSFIIEYSNLNSLKGCPVFVGDQFSCSYCNNLKTLEGAPKEVYYDFYCSDCMNLKSLKGCPKKIGGNFDCSNCDNLVSLSGCPKKVGGYFNCEYCGTQFTEQDVKKYCQVTDEVIV